MLRSFLAAALALLPGLAPAAPIVSSRTPSARLAPSRLVWGPAAGVIAAPRTALAPAVLAPAALAPAMAPAEPAASAPAAPMSEAALADERAAGEARFDGAESKPALTADAPAAGASAGRAPLAPAARAAAKPSAAPSGVTRLFGMGSTAALAQLWPWSLVILAAAAMVAADVWTRGGVQRKVRDAWRLRSGYIEEGVASDLNVLFELREADEARLKEFLGRWRGAKSLDARVKLADEAAQDEVLWRQKLSAALLSSGSPDVQDRVMGAARKAARSRGERLAPIVEKIASRRDSLSWLAHPDAQARLSLLETVAGLKAPAEAAPAALTRRVLAGRAAAVAVLAAAIGGAGLTTQGKLRHMEESRAASAYHLRQFYGEDFVLFSDTYSDERIARFAVPALERWHDDPKEAGADLVLALTVLRQSSDPKADYILGAIFKRVSVLPLDEAGETELIKALVERDSETLWNGLDGFIKIAGGDPAAKRIVLKLVEEGARSSSDSVFAQTFRALKSQDLDIQRKASELLYARLAKYPETFYAQLVKIQTKHPNDPLISAWTMLFTFHRLDDAAFVADKETNHARAVIDRALRAAWELDRRIEQNLAQVKPGKPIPEDGGVLAYQAKVLADALKGGTPSPRVASAARHAADTIANYTLSVAVSRLQGLRLELEKAGVILPGGRRDVYRLSEMRGLGAAIARRAEAAADEPNQRAMLAVFFPALKEAYALAKAAGAPEGGTPAALAADDLRPHIGAVSHSLTSYDGDQFMAALREKKLAPLDPFSPARAFPESLDAAQVAAFRSYLLELVKGGTAWYHQGKTRPISSRDKRALAAALDAADATLWKRFPETGAPPADPDAALFVSLTRAGEETLAFARLDLALDARPKDGNFAVKVQAAAFARLRAAPSESSEFEDVMKKVGYVAFGSDRAAAAAAALVNELKGELPGRDAVIKGVRSRAGDAASQVLSSAERAAPGLREKLLDAGVRSQPYADWRPDYKLRHLDEARRVLAAALAAPGTPERRAAITSARTALLALRRVAVASGVPAGGAPGEIAAERAQDIVMRASRDIGYELLNGVWTRLRDLKVTNGYRALPKTMTRQQVLAVRTVMREIRLKNSIEAYGYKDGQYQRYTRPLNADELKGLTEAEAALGRAAAALAAPAKKTAAAAPTGAK